MTFLKVEFLLLRAQDVETLHERQTRVDHRREHARER